MTSQTRPDTGRFPIGRLVCAALLAAGLYLGVFTVAFGGMAHWPGSESYIRIAANLVAGKGFSLDGIYPTALRPPLYSLILAATMELFGPGWFVASMALQTLASGACIVLAFATARRLGASVRTCWIAAGLLALHGPFMFEMLSLRETVWFTLALMTAGWLVLNPRRRAWEDVALGVAVACTYLLRPTGLLVVAVTAGFLGYAIARGREASLRSLVLCLVAAAVVAAPWQVFTWRAFGAPGFFPSSANGFNLAKGADPELTSLSPWIDADTLDPRIRKLIWRVPWQDERAIDSELRSIAFGLIRAEPGAIAGRILLNGVAFISPLPVPLGSGSLKEHAYGVEIVKFRPHWEEIAFSPVVLVLLVCAAVGTRRLWGREGPTGDFVLWGGALFAIFLAVHSLTFTKSRYRLPLDGLAVVPAAYVLASRKRTDGQDASVGSG